MSKLKFLEALWREQAGDGDLSKIWDEYVDLLDVKRDQFAIDVKVFPGCDGVARWRVYPYFMELAKNPRYVISMSRHLSEREDSEVCWFQRTMVPRVIVECLRRRYINKFTVLDTDDYLHEIPTYNPARRGVIGSGQPEIQDALVRSVHRVVYGTRAIQNAYTKHYGNLFPNYKIQSDVLELTYDPDFFPQSEAPLSKPDGAVVLGYWGSATHSDDIDVAADAVASVMSANKNVWLLTLQPNSTIREDPWSCIPSDRRIHVGWLEPWHTMHRWLDVVDIGLAPLIDKCQCTLCNGQKVVQDQTGIVDCPECNGTGVVDNVFNKTKSDLKLVEYGMKGIPCIATPTDALNGSPIVPVESGHDVDTRWRNAISRLVVDTSLRKKIGREAKRYVSEHRSVKACVGKLDKILRDLAGAT